MKRLTSFAVVLLAFCTFVNGQQTLPLNTGYNHAIPGPYPTVTTGTSTTNDNYWINIASHPTTTPALGPSWVIQQLSPWRPAMTYTSGGVNWGSSWINARNTNAGGGSSMDDKGYVIFRKCFCLLPGFNQASLTFQIRVDDQANLWFNSIANLLGTVPQNYGSVTPFSGGTTNQNYFQVGKNCFYILLEDFQGWMGFNLVGAIKANGLLPTVASWNGQAQDAVFAPCPCSSPTPSPLGNPKNAKARVQAPEDEQKVINDIIKFAEARRAAKQKK
jgi:hypothetical protein